MAAAAPAAQSSQRGSTGLDVPATEDEAVLPWQSVQTGETDGAADLEDRVIQAFMEMSVREEVEPEYDNESASEVETGPPMQAQKRKIFTPEQRHAAATRDAEVRVHTWRETHNCCCEEADCLLQFDQDALLREMVVFRKMTESERAALLSGILAVNAAAPGVTNTVSAGKWKKRKWVADSPMQSGNTVLTEEMRTSIAYAFHGKSVCAMAFSAIFQISNRNVRTLAQGVCSEYESPQLRKPSSTGRQSAQTTIGIQYIRGMARQHAMQQPSARGGASKNGRPRLFFMSHHTKMVLYGEYKKLFPDLAQAAIDIGSITGAAPTTPLQAGTFLGLWKNYCPEIRVFQSGSDYCDVCTAYRNNPNPTDEETVAFKKHVDGYKEERSVYANGRKIAMEQGAKADYIGFIFDFAGQ